MTSKQRVRAVMQQQPVDKIPAAFEAVSYIWQQLMQQENLSTADEVYRLLDIDIIPVEPTYIGPALKQYRDKNGNLVEGDFWGYETTHHKTTIGTYGMTSYFPLKGAETIEDVKRYQYPNPDWFDYSVVTKVCEEHPDKAIILGHPGPFQMVTNLMEMDEFFILMMDEPETAQYILDRMVDFELEYYRRSLEAGKGMIDVLRTHDDYGTQISMLFSLDMWKEFFERNTKRLVDLAHQYGAFFQQHSCGAIAPVIPSLIACGVDAIEPVQKVQGLEVNTLAELYGGKVTFHGGIDTQDLLPNGTPEMVQQEVKKFMHALGKTNSYILMSSQSFETDTPLENIKAVYSVDRTASLYY